MIIRLPSYFQQLYGFGFRLNAWDHKKQMSTTGDTIRPRLN